jgi:hypothetical protein
MNGYGVSTHIQWTRPSHADTQPLPIPTVAYTSAEFPYQGVSGTVAEVGTRLGAARQWGRFSSRQDYTSVEHHETVGTPA